jgi:putative membrane protein (TIGR04086 family)
MGFNQEKNDSLTYVSIFRGSMVTLLGILLATIVIGIIVHFGVAVKAFESGSLYMLLLFASLAIGAIYAGSATQQMGWITGAGVGFVTSLFLLMIAMGAGQEINWSIYPLKALINCFIGAFGGIIGINTARR